MEGIVVVIIIIFIGIVVIACCQIKDKADNPQNTNIDIFNTKIQSLSDGERAYVYDAIKRGFDKRLIAYVPKRDVIMFVRLWELNGITATIEYFARQLNLSSGSDVIAFYQGTAGSFYRASSDEHRFNEIIRLCKSRNWLCEKYCCPADSKVPMLMYTLNIRYE